LSSQELRRSFAKAKRAAKDGPVFITERGRPAYVLLTVDEYRKISGRGKTLAEALAMPGAEEIDFDPPRIELRLQPAKF
jgi:prevent-host-death family protein